MAAPNTVRGVPGKHQPLNRSQFADKRLGALCESYVWPNAAAPAKGADRGTPSDLDVSPNTNAAPSDFIPRQREDNHWL